MFSLFRKDSGASPQTISRQSMLPRRMDLEERKAFRRELLDQVIRESLLALEVENGMYRLRLMPLDTRHHRFVAMIEVGRGFQPRRGGRAWDDPETENWIRKCAYERFGLLLEAIYWRSGAAAAATRSAATLAAAGPTHPHYQLVSEEEKEALMKAIRQGSELPVLHVGDWEYQTDMAPLGERGAPGAG
ncbi:MAG: hypothetical protein Q8R72_14730 [Hylemonella sp.]|nr:hypothetical protein [Hylemonella sp.]